MIRSAAIAASVAFFLAAAQAVALEEVRDFSPNPGDLDMHRYVPENLEAGRPLVVLLHGCGQGAADFDDETGWVKLADTRRFSLLLPQQRRTNNLFKCFNWFLPGDARRDRGEAASIMAMVRRMIADLDADPARVFVTGLSAGGAMTSVLLATYPEAFAGGAVVAGIPFGCANDPVEGMSCMLYPRAHPPEAWGRQVRAATSHQGPWPRVSIWQGSDDTWVKAAVAEELMKQWTHVHGIDQIPDREEELATSGDAAIRRAYADEAGVTRVETILIPGMDHGVAIAPGACGKAGSYVLDVGLCAAEHTARFWRLNAPR